jgi:Na+-translocating ferredoxin:NAD+ oxidoreductase RnfG subunit
MKAHKKGGILSRYVKSILITLAIVSIISAAIYGNLPQDENDLNTYLPEAIPEAESYNLIFSDPNDYRYIFSGDSANGDTMGYITISQGQGFGGKVTTVLGWSPEGTITYLNIVEHDEDIVWWQSLSQEDFFDQYVGRQYSESLELFDDIDAVTGSTYSCRGVSTAVHNGRTLVAEELGYPYPEVDKPIKFGNEEIFVLIGIGLVVSIRTIPVLRRLRWIRYLTLLFGFIAFGIWLLIPLSLTNFVIWFTGAAPVIETQLYMYLLALGLVTLVIIMGRNFWCHWLCPYAAVQEVMHVFGKVSLRPSQRVDRILRNARYILLWFAVFLALLLASASISVFEPWSTLFNLKGNIVGWMIVALTLGFALVIRNFWCIYLCPVGTVMDLLIHLRKRIVSVWKKTKRPLTAKNVI